MALRSESRGGGTPITRSLSPLGRRSRPEDAGFSDGTFRTNVGATAGGQNPGSNPSSSVWRPAAARSSLASATRRTLLHQNSFVTLHSILAPGNASQNESPLDARPTESTPVSHHSFPSASPMASTSPAVPAILSFSSSPPSLPPTSSSTHDDEQPPSLIPVFAHPLAVAASAASFPTVPVAHSAPPGSPGPPPPPAPASSAATLLGGPASSSQAVRRAELSLPVPLRIQVPMPALQRLH